MITEYPLTKAHRIQLARAFADVSRVDLAIECVIEGQMGKAYVDNIQTSSAYKIQVGSFFYLAGDPLGDGGQEILRDIQPWTLLMSSSPSWIEAASRMYGERLIPFDRYSFSSECLSVRRLESLSRGSRFSQNIRQMDLATALQVWGRDHFVDISDFDSPDDFVERGIGFYAVKDEQILGAAYSSLVCSTGIEVSLFVAEEYRRQGMATLLSARLIMWCLENNMEPHWDAANPESCKLAMKLGYISKGEYQAYYLKPE